MSEPPATNLSARDLGQLTNELHEVTDPHTLGIKLGIQAADVKRILQDAGSTTERQKSGILDHWLKNDFNASWSTLVKALEKMDHKRLAQRLEKTYCSQEAKGKLTYIALELYTYLELTILDFRLACPVICLQTSPALVIGILRRPWPC